jgi:hypothetical protein
MNEAENLKRENTILQKDLVELKQTLEALVLQRTGDAHEEDQLLALENYLLRAQIQEEAAFLEGCKLLREGMPSERPSRITTKPNPDELMRLSSENAMNEFCTLLCIYPIDDLFRLTLYPDMHVSRSENAKDWIPVDLPIHCFESAVPGLNITCNYRVQIPDPINQPDVAAVYIRVGEW